MPDYNVFPDYKTRKEIINELCDRYKFIKHCFAGKSVCGRGIDVLHIGNTKNRVLYCGGFHGSEYLTILALLKFFEECCEAMESDKTVGGCKIGNFLSIRGLTIVPCVNPDGTEIALHGSDAAFKYKPLVEKVCTDTYKWQANARGVDINHNFNAGWCRLKQLELKNNIKCPAPTRFGGNHPESEPETKALTTLCRNIDFERAIALHSQGREIYCSFGRHTPVLSFRLASIFSQASGYNIAFPEEIATGGGFKDWFIEKFRRPALTIEMGLGKNPLPSPTLKKNTKFCKTFSVSERWFKLSDIIQGQPRLPLFILLFLITLINFYRPHHQRKRLSLRYCQQPRLKLHSARQDILIFFQCCQ